MNNNDNHVGKEGMYLEYQIKIIANIMTYSNICIRNRLIVLICYAICVSSLVKLTYINYVTLDEKKRMRGKWK